MEKLLFASEIFYPRRYFRQPAGELCRIKESAQSIMEKTQNGIRYDRYAEPEKGVNNASKRVEVPKFTRLFPKPFWLLMMPPEFCYNNKPSQ